MKEPVDRKFARYYGKMRKCIQVKGQFCTSCGKDMLEYPWEVIFHHQNPDDKSHGISQILHRHFAEILKELGKCVLLCSPCHAKNHFDIERYNRLLPQIKEQCSKIDLVNLDPINEDRVYELVKKGLSSEQIGREMGVSGRSIRTIIRRLEKVNNEHLMDTIDERTAKIRKITDDEIIKCRAQGMTYTEIVEQFHVSGANLCRRIKRLKELGLINDQPKRTPRRSRYQRYKRLERL